MAIALSRRNLLVGSAMLLAMRPALASVLRLASYHNQPPFMLSPTTGLTFDLADYLEIHLGLPVAAEIVPRNRLDSELSAAASDLMVPWVSPTWFPPALVSQMVFSPPLLSDENIVVSNAQKPIEYAGASSLIGYRMGVVTGRVHKDIDRLVTEGKIVLSSARTPALNLEMLASGRVDFVIMPGATWHALVPLDRRSQFYLAKQPQESFTRHIMMPGTSGVLIEKVSAIATAMRDDRAWRKILKTYELDDPKFTLLPT